MSKDLSTDIKGNELSKVHISTKKKKKLSKVQTSLQFIFIFSVRLYKALLL